MTENKNIITVKNAEGDPDTTAEIIIQNKIDFEPKVSVIIPVYNVEEYLRECLDSVINQTLKEIEIICVDDGSTDSSLEILKEYAKKDNRFTVMKQENLHAGVARNAGLAVAKGEYLSFLDSDDFFELNMLEEMSKKADKDESDVVICGFYEYDNQEKKDLKHITPRNEFIHASPFTPQSFSNIIFNISRPNPWTKLFKKNLFDRTNIRFEKLKSCNDLTCVWCLIAYSNRLSVLNKNLIHYRINTKSNISATRNKNPECLLHAINKVADILFTDNKNNDFYNSFINQSKLSINYELSLCNIEQKNKFLAAAKEILQAKVYDSLFNIKLSVIVPIYNAAPYLLECLDSIANQSLKEIEVICINDGSTDASSTILWQYFQKDNRLVIIDKENEGSALSKNKGINIARGEYLCFIDADDIYPTNDILESMYNSAKEHQVSVCGGEFSRFTDNQKNLTQIFSETQFGYKFETPNLIKYKDYQFDYGFTRFIYKRSLIENNNLLFPNYKRYEDPVFFVKTLFHAKQFYALNKITYAYRRGHNPVQWTVQKVNDLLSGILDNLQFAKNNSLEILYQLSIERLKEHINIVKNNKNLETFEILKKIQKTSFDICNFLKTVGLYSSEVSYTNPLVSVIVPTYNVELYLSEALDSLLNQSLNEIEIICIDDGSTDNSGKILDEYAQKDLRIKVIHKENGGYGKAMNVGLDNATGEYIGILEPDDFVELNMYETLYNKAKELDLDIIKSDFNRFVGTKDKLKLYYNQLDASNLYYNKITNYKENINIFNFIMNTWSGIYKRSFIEKYKIRHNETPGASFQDNGFWFKSFMHAKKIYFLNKPFYMNRRDNPNSSVKSKEKVMCIKNEYDHILNYLNQYPDDKKKLIGMYHYKKFHNYMFNFDRIDIKFKWEWLQIFSKEYKEAYALNEIDENLFSSKELNWLRFVISNPNKFYKQRLIIMEQTLEHKNFARFYLKSYLLFPIYLIKTARMKKKIHKKVCRIIRVQLSNQFENTALLSKQQIRDFALKNSPAPDYTRKYIKKITNDIYDKFHFRKKHRILGIKFYTKNKHKELSSLLTYSIKQNELIKKENTILKSQIEELSEKSLKITNLPQITDLTIIKNKYVFDSIKLPNMKNNWETIEELINTEKSIIRMGDGEYNIIEGGKAVFQKENSFIAEKLKEILLIDDDNLLVGIPEPYYTYPTTLSETSKRFIYNWLPKWHEIIMKYNNPNKTYYSTFISQTFPVFASYNFEEHYSKLKKIWDNKDITIITGDRVFNKIDYNIFENAKSIEYIYGPTVDAFNEYDSLKEKISKTYKNRILIFALGPCGKILAYDMYKQGYRVLDLGHLIKDYDFYKKSISMTKQEFSNARKTFFGKD